MSSNSFLELGSQGPPLFAGLAIQLCGGGYTARTVKVKLPTGAELGKKHNNLLH